MNLSGKCWGILLLGLLWAAGPSWAQPVGRHCDHALFGVVTDSETLEPLIYARVYLKGAGKGAITGLNGEYRIEGICDGPDSLMVSHVGCGLQVYAVTIEENTHYDLQLPHSQSHVDTVHIHDRHADPKVTQAESGLSGKALDEAAGQSLGKALSSLSGVTALQTGPSIFKPVIHGMHSNRIVIMNNGVRQESQQWGSEHAPEIDPFTATRLRVVKGANGVRYGPDAIAGVVLVEPGELPDSTQVRGALQLVGMSNGWMGAGAAYLEGRSARLPALAWRVQGSMKRGGNVHTPDYVLANTALRELNGSAAVAYQKERWGVEGYYSHFGSDLAIFAGSHIGNLTDLERAIASDTPLVHGTFGYEIGRPKQHIAHDLAKLKAWWETGHVGVLSLTAAFQHNLRQEYDNHRSAASDSGAPQLHYEIVTTSGEVLWEHNKWHDLKGTVGLSFQNQVNAYEGFYFIPNFLNYNVGPFLIERLVKLRWELEMGLRYDYRWNQAWFWQGGEIQDPVRSWQNGSGSLGGVVRINEHASLHANVGTAWRPPTMNELYSRGLHHGAASFEIGDSTLQAEQALNSTLSFHYQGHGKLEGELGAYLNYIRDFIYQEPVQPATLTVRGAFPTFLYRQVDARFMGVDAAIGWHVTDRLAFSGKASMVRAQNLDRDEPLIYIPADRFSAGLGYVFRNGKRLQSPQLGVDAVLVRRQDRFPAGIDYADPPAGYLLLNAEASATLSLGKLRLDLGLACHNLLNARYREYMNRFRYYADEMGRNWSIRLKIPFAFPSKTQQQ